MAAILSIVIWHHVAKLSFGLRFWGSRGEMLGPPAKISAAYFDFRSLFFSAAYLFPQLIMFEGETLVSRPGPAG